ncbi:MAG: BMC domain-containing protein [Armatimonadota bacterium]
MEFNAIGMLEFTSISAGINAADQMLKTSKVILLEAHPICPGKYMVLIAGGVDEVASSIEVGKRTGDSFMVDEIIIPNIHPGIFPALTASSAVSDIKALGVFETFSAASAISSADKAVKAANVELIDLRLANGMGGKSYFTLTGEVYDVEAAMKAAEEELKDKGLIVNSVVIPSTHKELSKALL